MEPRTNCYGLCLSGFLAKASYALALLVVRFLHGFATAIYHVGHASGPILAGLLIGLSNSQDFRLAFAIIASILVVSALFFRRTIPASS